MTDLTAWKCGHLTKLERGISFNLVEWEGYLKWANQVECPSCRRNEVGESATWQELIEWAQR